MNGTPKTPYDLPLCSEHELNAALIEAARRGDRSAAALLTARYASTFALGERHRVGAAVLHDPHIWNDMLARAEICLRFPNAEAPAYVAAVMGLAIKRDAPSLPDIDRAMQRFPNSA